MLKTWVGRRCRPNNQGKYYIEYIPGQVGNGKAENFRKWKWEFGLKLWEWGTDKGLGYGYLGAIRAESAA